LINNFDVPKIPFPGEGVAGKSLINARHPDGGQDPLRRIPTRHTDLRRYDVNPLPRQAITCHPFVDEGDYCAQQVC